MPITPLHFGPALQLKRAAGHRFSLTAFAASQVLLDIEPGLKLFGFIPEQGGLHLGHTWSMGAGIAAVAGLGAWLALRLRGQNPTVWISATSAALGVLSHLALDSVYHADVAAGLGFPGLSGVVPQGWLDVGLLVALVAGVWILDKTTVK